MAIKKSNVARKDLFVTSKVWNTDRGYDNTLKAFDKSLSDLQLDYLDLYLIHWPATEHRFENWKEINGETWAALEKLLADGKVRAIGVSNFMPHHLKPLLETAKVQPMVNQIEFHPGYTQHECVDFCKEHNIVIEAWSPLGTGAVLNNHILMSIAHKYQKSVAQICLRWVLQHGVLPIVKSVTPKRIEENIEIFDFVISNDDMKLINNITNCGGICQHPDKINF